MDQGRHTYRHSDQEEITRLLVGRRIVSASEGVMTLDDGTKVTVSPNEGCGGCVSGWYEVDEIAATENVITAVAFTDTDITEDLEYGEDAHRYEIFVVAANKSTRILSVSGDDGNGYYGTGYWLGVSLPEKVGD